MINRKQITAAIAAIMLLSAIPAYADYFNKVWWLQSTDPSSDHGSSMGIDPQGDLLLTGQYNFTPSHWDNYLAKYSGQGQEKWTVPSTPPWSERFAGISVDSQGNSYIPGYANGPSGGSYYGFYDGFVRKYDSSGGLIWQRQAGTSDYDTWLNGSVNANGDFFVTGHTFGTLAPGTSGPRPDTTVAKYDSAGNLQWIRQWDVGGSEYGGGSIISDAPGNVYLTGTANGTGNSSSQAFLMKLAPDGSPVWTRAFGVTGVEMAAILIAGFDAQGNIIFSGETKGSLAGTWQGGWDIYAGRCDPDGNIQWIGQYGSSGNDYGGMRVLDSSGNITWVGFTDGSLFGANQGGYDAYIAQTAADGTLLGGTQFGTPGFDLLSGLCTNGTDWFVTGYTDNSLWGQNAGGYDMLLGKLSTEAQVVPVPAGVLLGLLGLGTAGWRLRRRGTE